MTPFSSIKLPLPKYSLTSPVNNTSSETGFPLIITMPNSAGPPQSRHVAYPTPFQSLETICGLVTFDPHKQLETCCLRLSHVCAYVCVCCICQYISEPLY